MRSFTVLDGIGKSLDPRFDISEISAPYARNLLLEGQPQVGKGGEAALRNVTLHDVVLCYVTSLYAKASSMAVLVLDA